MNDSNNKSIDLQKKFVSSNIVRATYTFLGALVFLFASYHGLNNYIDSRINNRINDSNFLHELAMRVRPSLVIDNKGSIVADMGAVEYLDEIKVAKIKDGHLRITVSPKIFIAVEPVIEALDSEYSVQAERGQKFDWIFDLFEIQQLVAEASPQRINERFRVEIIR